MKMTMTMTMTNRRHAIGRRLTRAASLCLLALAAMLLQAHEARAQWTTSGATTSTTNNVGIGTSTPSSTLEVQGPDGTLTLSQPGVPGKAAVQAAIGTDLHMSANARWTTSAWGRNDPSLPSWNIFLAPSAGADYAGIRRAAPSSTGFAWTDIMRITNEGHVGIGTTAVRYPLTVRANTNLAPLNLIGGTGSMEIWKDANPLPSKAVAFGSAIPGNPAGDDIQLSTYNGSAWASRLTVSNSTGNVGIGTTSPNYSLVVGPLMPSGLVAATMTVSKGANTSSSIVVGASGTSLAEVGWDNPNGRAFLNAAGSTPIAITQNGTNVRMFVTSSGDIGVGTTTPAAGSRLHVAGNITVDGNINAKYQDVAEWVPTTQKLAAGTVVILDTKHENHVTASISSYDTRVAGVVSARPGLTLGEAGDSKALVATTGRVKVKVDATRAPIQIGDLIVTSDQPGVAMKSEPVSFGGVAMHRPGTIIGKALESLEKGTGEILVLLSLQ